MRKTRNIGSGTKFKIFKNFIYIFIAISLVLSLIKNISRIKNAEIRITEAQMRVEKLEEERMRLESQLSDMQSDIYVETRIREGLGLAREDEIIIVLPDEEVLRRVAPDFEEEEDADEEIPNWKKWLDLFVS